MKIIQGAVVVFAVLTIVGCARDRAEDSAVAGSADPGVAVQAASDDADFVRRAATGGTKEIELGNLAVMKATKTEVKEFAQRMVRDHTQSRNMLQEAAARRNIPATPDISEVNQVVGELSVLSGAAFDKAYMEMMFTEHQKTHSMVEAMSTTVKDPDVRAWAARTLPIVTNHLEHAETIVKGL